MTKRNRMEYIMVELGHHLPYTTAPRWIDADGDMTFFLSLRAGRNASGAREFFTLTIFYSARSPQPPLKHEKLILKAAIVGFPGPLCLRVKRCGFSLSGRPLIVRGTCGSHLRD